MKDILKIMDRDHEELAVQFTQFLLYINSNSEKSSTIFADLKRNLNKHFKWEEKILFPIIEERGGPAGSDITFVLKNEHTQIKKMFISKIERLVKEKNYSEILTLTIGLEEMLTMHRQYENDIFYPWFDDSLDEAEKKRVLSQLKAKKNKKK
jgi:iron-sulfur cluster repair protein YtfE (RIC family)